MRNLMILILVLLLSGCGGGGGGATSSDSSSSAGSGAGSPSVVTTSGETSGFTTPSPLTPTTAQVILKFTLLNAVPSRIDGYRVRGLDAAGSIVFGPETFAKSAQVTLTLPLTTKRIVLEYLQAGEVQGVSIMAVELSPGQTMTFTDPDVMQTGAHPTSLSAGPDVQLAKGIRKQMSALAEMSDSTTADLAASVTWSSSNDAICTVSNAAGQRGQVLGTGVGSATVTASLGDLTASATVVVTSAELTRIDVTPPNSLLPASTGEQLTATGTFTDASTEDLSSQVKWTSSVPEVAKVSASGHLDTFSAGVATVTATQGSISGQAQVTVNRAPLVSVVVTPAIPFLARGTQLQMVAVATFADGSTEDVTSAAAWSSTDSSRAPVSNVAGSIGRVTGSNVGHSDISASFGGFGQTRTVTVTDAELRSISVTPTNPAIAVGAIQDFTATGIFSDGTSQDMTGMVTWASDNGNVTVSSKTATGAIAGQSTITAVSGVISGSATITVISAPLTSITVTPATPNLPLNTSLQFIATGNYADGTTLDLTSAATWSADSAALSISNAATTRGYATASAASASPVTVTASFDGIDGAASVTVTAASLQRIDVSPTDPITPKGTSKAFTATGVYSDGTTHDLTGTVGWVSSAPSTMVMSGHTAMALVAGQATVQASYGGVTGSTTITVSSPSLDSITVSPASPTIANGTRKQFTATGNYSDGTTVDLTSQVTWDSSSSAVAVSAAAGSQGLATALATGSADISATLGAISASSTLTVTAATLVRIDVGPGTPAIAKGTTLGFTATGVYSDGSTQDLTGSASWQASSGVATMSTNSATGSVIGQCDITATWLGVSGSARLSVTGATLSSIAVTPSSPSAAKGTSLQFTATGMFTDGTTQNLSSLVSWSSSTGAAIVSNAAASKGLATAVSTGPANISATLGTVSAGTTLTVTSATLVRIDVAPVQPAIAKGTSRAFTATGVFTDGSSQDLTGSVSWQPADLTVASMTANVATGIAVGGTDIRATSGGVTGATRLSVSDAILVSIAVTPSSPSLARGTTVTLLATGTFTDGTSQDLSSSVSWLSDAPSKVSMSGSVATAANVGSANVSATFGTISGSTTVTTSAATLAALQVDPPHPTTVAGLTGAFTATGTFTDGTTQDLTSTVTWGSTASGVAAVSNVAGTEGHWTALTAGQSTVSATSGAVSAGTTLTVRNATLTTLTVSPANPSLAKGTTVQFTCTAAYSDGSNVDVSSAVTWSSSTAKAGVSNAAGSRGLVSALQLGTSAVSCTLSGVTSNSSTVTVTAATLQSIAITPVAPNIATGTTCQFTATGTYSDATTQDLTGAVAWSTSSGAVATVNASGLASGVSVGSAIITAQLGGVSGSTNLAVHLANLSSIAVTPANPSLIKGFTRQFVATGTYADGSTQDLSSQVTWTSGTTSVATISNVGGSRGLASTATATGTSQITATLGAVNGSTTLTVNGAVLQSIAVTPVAPTIIAGTSQTFTATGTFSDGSTADITGSVGWTSSLPTFAIIASNVAHGVSAGATTITATKTPENISGRTNLTVRAATLVSIAVTPVSTAVPQAGHRQFIATATYSDGTTQDITSLVTWASSLASVATISNAADSKGLGLGIVGGFTNITASFGGVTSPNAVLSVLAAITQVLAPGGAQPVGGPSNDHDVNADGSRVSFNSFATNYVASDTNGIKDAFVADTTLTKVVRVNMINGNTQVTSAVDEPAHLRISADGNWVVFDSSAALNSAADTNAKGDVYRVQLSVNAGNLVAGAPQLVTRVGTTGAVGNSDSSSPCISMDGNLVEFDTTATNLGGNSTRQVAVKDMTTGTITIVSRANGASGALSANLAYFPELAPGGRYAGFYDVYNNGSTNIDPGYTTLSGAAGNQYVRDMQTNTTFRLARPALHAAYAFPLGGTSMSFSDDGKVIAFESDFDDLVPNDTNQLSDIFVFVWDGNDPATGVISRVSVQDISVGGGQCMKVPFNSSDVFSGCYNASISGDGRYVVYDSIATNLDPELADTNSATDVFVYDRMKQKTRRVSKTNNGAQGIGTSIRPHISRNGAYIIFQSNAALTGTDTNGEYDIYLVPNPLYE